MCYRTLTLLSVLTLTLLQPRPGQAKKCIGHAYELMELDLLQVTQGRKRVPTPAFFADRARLKNSGARGKLLHLRDTPDGQLAQFYQLEQAFPPAKHVQGKLRAAARRRIKTSCGTTIPVVPLAPGRYALQPAASGGKRSKLFTNPLLTVHPSRQHVTLSFTIKQLKYVALYRVACALFPAEARKRSCRKARP